MTHILQIFIFKTYYRNICRWGLETIVVQMYMTYYCTFSRYYEML